jgi:glycerol-3-phosphate O-acyltransferase
MQDEFERPARWFDFLRQLAELDLQVHVRFGRPVDVLGNPVDGAGVSRDPHGRAIDPVRYLFADGACSEDEARDTEYTRMLGSALTAAYRRSLVALPSHVLAFALFERLRQRFPSLDIFRLLRVLSPRVVVGREELDETFAGCLAQLRELSRRGALQLAPELQTDNPAVALDRGLRALGSYHHVPVVSRMGSDFCVGDPALLFYYRNRLDGFGLLESPVLHELCSACSRSKLS